MKSPTKELLLALALGANLAGGALAQEATEGNQEAAPAEAAPAGAQAAPTEQQAPPAEQPQAAPITEAQPEAAPAGSTKPDMVADGNRISLRDNDLSVAPPRGWEVYTHLPSLTMLAQVPHKEGVHYQRTIQIASFSGPRFIDEVTAKEYEDVIVRKFSQATASIEGYHIRNHMNIEMADGRDGLLFYSEFTIAGVNLMQAHILVSGAERHYLLSYTDVAEHFENDAANQYLTEAWDSMISVQLATRTPVRFESAVVIGGGALGLFVLGLLVMGIRRWKSGREYRAFAEGKGLGDVDLKSEAPKSISTSQFGSISSVQASIQSVPEPPKRKKVVSMKKKSKPADPPESIQSQPEEPFETQEDKAI